MQLVNAPRVAAASGALLALVFAPGTNAGEDNNEDEVGRFRPKFAQEFAVGGISRVGGRDPGLIGGGNGGTGTSINYDDGNLNYGRGLASLAVQGRSSVSGESQRVEIIKADVPGLALPREVIDKIYYGNAKRAFAL